MKEEERLISLRLEIEKMKAAGRPSHREAAEKLRSVFLRKAAEGASVKALAAALARRGVKVGERGLKSFLDTGRLPARKTSEPEEFLNPPKVVRV